MRARSENDAEFDEAFEVTSVLRSPFLGLTVRRGPDWDWGDQDGGGLGVTVAEGEVHTSDWVQVRWARGGVNSYRVGAQGKFDLVLARSPEHLELQRKRFVVAGAGSGSVNGRYACVGYANGRPLYRREQGGAVLFFEEKWKISQSCAARMWHYQHPAPSEEPPTGPWALSSLGEVAAPAPSVFDEAEGQVLTSVELGVLVRRGPDWEWQDQDEGGLGITVEAARTGWVAVRWDYGGENKYRVGADGKFDLVVVGRAVQTVRVQGAGGVGEAVNGWFDQEGMYQGKPKYKQRGGQAIIYFSSEWKINDEDDTSGWYYSHPNACASHPPGGYWTTEGYTGRDAYPAPMVSGEAELPASVLRHAVHGLRVMRGPGWRWGNQDGGRLGITMERTSATPGWVGVRWDGGVENNYRVGADDCYDLLLVPRLRISGAGGRGRQVNGRYTAQGTCNGRPKFHHEEGQSIIYFNVSWKINYCDDVRGWYYQHPCQSSLPPSGSWTTEGYLGEDAEPAPRVHRCIEVGDEVRAVEVSEVPWCQCPLPRLQLLLGASFTVTALRGEWFQARSGHWGPLCAVELSQDASDACGFDEDWVCPEEAERQKCPVCLLVARQALAHECGELFCEECWVRCQAEDDRCPVCRTDGRSVAPAYASRKHIMDLQIACPKGCGQVCRLGDKALHMGDRCGHREVSCGHCGLELRADQLKAHEAKCRDVWPVCQLCGLQVKDLAEHLEAARGEHMAVLMQQLSDVRSELQELRRHRDLP